MPVGREEVNQNPERPPVHPIPTAQQTCACVFPPPHFIPAQPNVQRFLSVSIASVEVTGVGPLDTRDTREVEARFLDYCTAAYFVKRVRFLS